MEKIRGSRQFVSAVAAALLTLTACTSSNGSSGNETAPPATSSAQPKQGGTLTLLWPGDSPSLATDQGTGPSATFGIIAQLAIYDALMVVDTDATIQYRLAKSLTSTNGTDWTLVLDSGTNFSDGTPLDAAAVKANWSAVADPATRSPSIATAQQIANMAVVDATTLKITLKKKNMLFPALVAQTALAFIGSPTAMKKLGTKFALHPVGAGAFKLKERLLNDHTTLVRSPTSSVKAYLDTIVVKTGITDETQRLNALKTGGGDVDWSQDINIGKQAKAAGMLVQSSLQNGGGDLIFNTARPPFDNVKARQAVNYAIDSAAYTSTLYGSTEAPAKTYFLKDSPFFADVPTSTSDSKKAQALFDEVANANGGKPLTFSLHSVGGNAQQQASYIQARLASFKNVKVTIAPTTTDISFLFKGDFDVSLANQPRSVDPYPGLNQWLGSGGPLNFGKYSNAEFDKALAHGAASADVAVRKSAYKRVAQLLAQDVPIAGPFYRVPSQNIVKPSVFGAYPVFNDGVPDITRIWKTQG